MPSLTSILDSVKTPETIGLQLATILDWSRLIAVALAALLAWRFLWPAIRERRRNRAMFTAAGIALVYLTIVGIPQGLGRVQPGARGIVLRFGAPNGTVLGEGLYYVVPFVDRVAQVNTQTNTIELDRAQATTHDLEPVYVSLDVTFHVDPNRVIDVYRQLRNQYAARVVRPATKEALKSAISGYQATDLIVERGKVENDLRGELSGKLAPYGLVLDSVSTERFNYAYTYAQAAQARVASVQRTLQAQQDLQRVQAEAQQNVIRAESEVKSLKLQRDIPVDQLMRMRQLDLERKAVDKWDGHLPSAVGTGQVPFVGGALGKD